MSGGRAPYKKGYRFEKETQSLLGKIGTCTRSVMSRGADLTLWRHLQCWTVSCKARKDGLKFFYDELEAHDILAIKCNRKIPMIVMLAPKFAELVGKAEAEDVEAFMASERR
jgi:hypothetical protein